MKMPKSKLTKTEMWCKHKYYARIKKLSHTTFITKLSASPSKRSKQAESSISTCGHAG